MKLIIASNNQGKIREIKNLLTDTDLEIQSMKEAGYTQDIPEDGDTFYQNALLKARALRASYPDAYILADDSGLEVDALQGAPGVYSARYAGPDSTQEQLINKLLRELEKVPFSQRTARFVCMMILLTPQDHIHSAQGICHGSIAFAPRGIQGFGYDPVFLPTSFQFSRTFAEIEIDDKNQISHRARALRQIQEILRQILSEN